MKSRRVFLCVLLGIFWLAALALTIFLLPKLYQYKNQSFDPFPYLIGHTVILAALYGLSSAFFASLINLRGHFAIRRRSMRFILLAIGFGLAGLYSAVFLFPDFASNELFSWFWEFPSLFFLIGALLYCGFNPPSKSS